MEIGRILAFIFDLDGTLVRLPIDYEDLRRKLRTAALKHGIFNEFRPIIGEIKEISRNDKELADELLKIVETYEEKASEKAEPVPGAKEALTMLKKNGFKIAVVSNNSLKCVKNALRNTNLADYVDVVVGRQGFTVKPDPQPIEEAIKMLNVSKDAVVMIGDGENDLLAANRAGIKFHLFDKDDLFEFVCNLRT